MKGLYIKAWTLWPVVVLIHARDITFPPMPYLNSQQQQPLSQDDVDITTGGDFCGLTTFANVPYRNCYHDSSEIGYIYDIAIIGAPFDTVSAHSALFRF